MDKSADYQKAIAEAKESIQMLVTKYFMDWGFGTDSPGNTNELPTIGFWIMEKRDIE